MRSFPSTRRAIAIAAAVVVVGLGLTTPAYAAGQGPVDGCPSGDVCGYNPFSDQIGSIFSFGTGNPLQTQFGFFRTSFRRRGAGARHGGEQRRPGVVHRGLVTSVSSTRRVGLLQRLA